MANIVFWIAASALYVLWLSAPLALTLGVILWVRGRKTDRANDYALLFTLVLPWLAGGACALVLARRPAFAAEPTAALALELLIAIGLAVGLKPVRRAAIFLGLLNLYVAIGVWLWGSMAIQDAWL